MIQILLSSSSSWSFSSSSVSEDTASSSTECSCEQCANGTLMHFAHIHMWYRTYIGDSLYTLHTYVHIRMDMYVRIRTCIDGNTVTQVTDTYV